MLYFLNKNLLKVEIENSCLRRYTLARLKRGPLILKEEERESLLKIINSRNSPVAQVERANILLLFSEGKKINKIVEQLQTTRRIINRCIKKAYAYGALKSLKDLPRSGRNPSISDDAKSWVLSLACQSPKELGYAAEMWTYSALIKHIRNNCKYAGHDCLSKIGKGRLNMILSKGNIKPHKISYYLERRDPEFEIKMAHVLCVYKEIQIINETPNMERTRKSVTISYDEKPGIQAIKNLAPQLSPIPGEYQTIARDHQYKRLGTVSLLAGIDLHTGHVISLVRDRHRSQEFIEFLKLVDQTYPKNWKIRIILDNHSAHTSVETQGYLLSLSNPNRFEFIFTPKHGSWLNLIESFFSKISRSFLRHIRVQSKEELVERIYKGIHDINQEPVIFRWNYKMDEISASL
jgi:transposase